jgi:hypothetical protein
MSYRVQAWSRDKWSLKQIRLETTLSFMKLVPSVNTIPHLNSSNDKDLSRSLLRLKYNEKRKSN